MNPKPTGIRTYQRRKEVEPERRPVFTDQTNLSSSEFLTKREFKRYDHNSSDDDEEKKPLIYPPPCERFKETFFRGALQDQHDISLWTLVDNRVPGTWGIERQMRFGSWCQMLGLTCDWLGGYLWVHFTPKQLADLHFVVKMKNEASVASLEEDLSSLQLASRTKNRPRKWRESHEKTSLVLEKKRLSSLGGNDSRRQLSLLPSKRDSLVENLLPRFEPITEAAAAEEEEEEKDHHEITQSFDLPDDLLAYIMEFVPVSELHSRLVRVSKQFARIGKQVSNAHFATSIDVQFSFDRFSQGKEAKLLGTGAYKSVFWLPQSDAALSVMDVNQVPTDIIFREASVSLVLSELVRNAVCPNFIETKQIFQLNGMWNQPQGHYQCVLMELCHEGDLEAFMKTFPGGVLPLSLTRSVLFQMCFGVYAGQRFGALRHYDIKCLNFFCKREQLLKPFRINTTRAVWVEDDIVIKLGDYGTADFNPHNLGKTIEASHFTTLENTPVEFFLNPDCVQDYASDGFQLGLSVLHVLTGGVPYEEILDRVYCPSGLQESVSKVWKKKFHVVHAVAQSESQDILFHTLYRYLVLFGISAEDDGPVVTAIQRSLGVKKCQKQFEEDQGKYSIEFGKHHLIARGRDRAKELGVWDLLKGLVEFAPAKRWTPQQCIKMFESRPCSTEQEAFGEGS